MEALAKLMKMRTPFKPLAKSVAQVGSFVILVASRPAGLTERAFAKHFFLAADAVPARELDDSADQAEAL